MEGGFAERRKDRLCLKEFVWVGLGEGPSSTDSGIRDFRKDRRCVRVVEKVILAVRSAVISM